MRTKAEKEAHIEKIVEISENHRKSADNRMEKFCLRGICKDYIRISVEEYDSPEDASNYLKEKNLPEFLGRFIVLNADTYKKFKIEPKHPETEVITDISIVHFAWLMDMYDESRIMTEISIDEAVWRYYPVNRIWKDYHRMVGAFVNNKHYEPNPPKLKGYEKHWLPYIFLMGNFTRSEDISESLHLIDESFEKRNRDKRLENYPSFDGDGCAPVKWDLRKHTILKYGSKYYGYS